MKDQIKDITKNMLKEPSNALVSTGYVWAFKIFGNWYSFGFQKTSAKQQCEEYDYNKIDLLPKGTKIVSKEFLESLNVKK